MAYFDGMSFVGVLLFLATIGPPAFALADVIIRPAPAFPAAGKLTKPGWMLILVLAVIFALVWRAPAAFACIAGLIASVVYIVDVRPAVRAIGGSGRGSRPTAKW